MIPARRDRFNRDFTTETYTAFKAALTARCGVPIEFRLSETPCFLPAALAEALVGQAQVLIAQLLENPEYRRAADAVVPAAFRLARGEDRPTFIQVDFGLVRTPDGVEGRLVELQAFPSLYGFQLRLADAVMEAWQIDGVSPFLSGLSRGEYLAMARDAPRELGGGDCRSLATAPAGRRA